MLPPLLTRPIRRLRADGAVETVAAREPALGTATVLLARSLCRFERVRTPPSLGRSAAAAAARLHARARAPFSRSGSAVVRHPEGFGVWWWDAARIEPLLEAAGVSLPVRLRPEAAAQAGPDGWRLLTEAGGLEAQRWQGGDLVESAWRRGAFDEAAWRGVAQGEGPAPPPPVQRPLFVTGAAYGRRFLRGQGERSQLAAAALAAGLTSLCLTTFLAGQGVGAMRRGAKARAEIVRLETAPGRSLRPELAARARSLGALTRMVDPPGPLETLIVARTRLAALGLEVSGFDARRDTLTVSVPDSAAAGVDLLVQALQTRTPFFDVRPQLDRGARRLTLQMRIRPVGGQEARR